VAAIEQCRTEALGGHVYQCDPCDQFLYSYHSCKNRRCPKCQNDTGQQWLARQTDLLLPAPYFLQRTIFLWSLSPCQRRWGPSPANINVCCMTCCFRRRRR
jgi:hypothetical protein